MEACEYHEIPGCGRLIVCSESLEAGAPEEWRALVRAAPRGNLWNRIIGDEIIYVYASPAGGGFVVAASMEGLASGECGPRLREVLVPLVESMLREEPMLPFLVMVIEEKMLR